MSAPAPATAKAPTPPPAPSPIAVFVAFLEAKQTPPDLVIWCASAEAEMSGNTLLARSIADRYPDAMARRISPAPAPVAAAAPAPPTPVETPAAEAPAPVPIAPAPVSASAFAPSPIAGISDESWRAFCERLVRGEPTYQSERRIGRYHHRKDRLREIGFEPESLLGSCDAQDDALCADMADVHRHLTASGDAARHIGRPISLPDAPELVTITLSGLLGVASVAGLDDMPDWLAHKADRKKFPNTTAAFLRTNGVF
jgi:hypothetical protein